MVKLPNFKGQSTHEILTSTAGASSATDKFADARNAFVFSSISSVVYAA